MLTERLNTSQKCKDYPVPEYFFLKKNVCLSQYTQKNYCINNLYFKMLAFVQKQKDISFTDKGSAAKMHRKIIVSETSLEAFRLKL